MTEIPVGLLKMKDSKDAEYPMDNDEAKAEFLKASWASCGKVLNLLCLAGAAISNKNHGVRLATMHWYNSNFVLKFVVFCC